MPRFKNAQTGAVVSVSDATAEKLNSAWVRIDAIAEPGDSDTGENAGELFDPSAHNGDVVLAYLDNADDAERERVLEAERAGKNRKTIVGE